MMRHPGIQYLTPPDHAFEQLYLAVRQKEGRVYNPSQIRSLPNPSDAALKGQGWKLRAQTARRFRNYLDSKESGLRILDVGCGNGWFSNWMSSSASVSEVDGLDLNEMELRQASEVWASNAKLRWIYADIFTADLPKSHYHLITFNASVQYFSKLDSLLSRCLELLKPKGEIHILDSPFYRSQEKLADARQRTFTYYTNLGHPELAKFYTPPLWSDLAPFSHNVMWRPPRLAKMIFPRSINPFCWVKVVK